MKLQFGSRRFAPSWFGGLLTLAVLPGLIGLGLWQLRRADEKRELMTQAAQGRQQTLLFSAANAHRLSRYQRVSLAGRYDSAHQVLLDNMPSAHGQPGYRVLTPFRLDDGASVLVDRGWLPLGVDRGQRPNLDVGSATRQLTGMIDELPRPGVRAGNVGIHTGVWPQLLNYPTAQELRQLYGPALQTRIVLLDAAAADGFERIWQADVGFRPERHVGYAVQWFGMAVAVMIIFIVVNLKRPVDT